MARTLSILSIAFTLLQHTLAACYFRNGTATTADFSPCSLDASNPMSNVCCARWDTCLPNGLCQSFDDVIWRETCTKQNWDEGGCQELCSNERDIQRNDNIKVTPCDGTAGNSSSVRWCCGSSDACCSEGSDLTIHTIARRFGDPIPTASPSFSSSLAPSITSVSTLATSSTPTTTTSTPATSDLPATSRNTGLSAGAKAGVGVGVVLGVIALAALGLFIYKALQWRKTAYASKSAPPYSEEYTLHVPAETYRYQLEQKPEQLAGTEIHEMPNSQGTSAMSVAPAVDSSPAATTPFESTQNDRFSRPSDGV
ncbi:hypothetical protein IQ07DRAFT_582657 [Pyrenochaeta sp. DS3sAY3a]|nr:hypothetical protein IQ07DRAFT_582657 [Pyrenochaeta sp. DS3sAY3a]